MGVGVGVWVCGCGCVWEWVGGVYLLFTPSAQFKGENSTSTRSGASAWNHFHTNFFKASLAPAPPAWDTFPQIMVAIDRHDRFSTFPFYRLPNITAFPRSYKSWRRRIQSNAQSKEARYFPLSKGQKKKKKRKKILNAGFLSLHNFLSHSRSFIYMHTHLYTSSPKMTNVLNE